MWEFHFGGEQEGKELLCLSLTVPGAWPQEVNRYKGKNYPIMNIHERTLSVLACRVSGVSALFQKWPGAWWCSLVLSDLA